jgi:hypothetical protein
MLVKPELSNYHLIGFGDWGSGVPKPVGQVTTNVSSSSRNNNKKQETSKNIPLKTQQMKNLEAYKAKYAAMSTPAGQKDVVKQLLSVEKELQAAGHSVNLSKFLQQKGVSSDPSVPVLAWQAQSLQDVAIQKPIDVESIKDASWMRPVKKQEERDWIQQMQYGMKPLATAQTQETTEEPAARRMGFGQGGGAAQSTGYSQFIEPEPTNFTEWIAGRINTPIQEPETITKEPEIIEVTPEPIVKHTVKQELEPVNKSLIAIGAVIGLAALFLIWRAKK